MKPFVNISQLLEALAEKPVVAPKRLGLLRKLGVQLSPDGQNEKEAIVARFKRFVDQRSEEDCWNWTGLLTPSGYASFSIGRQGVRGHRFAFVIAHGKEPSGLVCHRCDNPKCVNPTHLFEGTSQDNSDDMRQKGRARYLGQKVNGVRNGKSKLNEDKVIQIRALALSGMEGRAIAKQFGVSDGTIYWILNNRTWRNVK